MKIIVKIDGLSHGPYSLDEVRTMILDGELLPHQEVKVIGQNEWIQLSTLPDLNESNTQTVSHPINVINTPSHATIVKKSSSHLAEYRRTCNACGKIWHSLVSREKEIINRDFQDALTGFTGAVTGCQTCGMCGTSTIAQSDRNRAANQTELQRLKSCPDCSSANFSEEVIEYVG